MAHKTRDLEARRDSPPKPADPHREGAFKPLAIPAVAAAVSAGANAQGRKPARRDIPAILRDGFAD
jgi:hypothetical protein